MDEIDRVLLETLQQDATLSIAQMAERVDIAGIAESLDPLFALFAAARRDGEGFGHFCHRIGIAALQQVVEGCRRQAA